MNRTLLVVFVMVARRYVVKLSGRFSLQEAQTENACTLTAPCQRVGDAVVHKSLKSLALTDFV